MFAILPLDTILRILDILSQVPGQASEYRLGTNSPESRPRALGIWTSQTRWLPAGLHRQGWQVNRADKEVGPLSRDEFAELREWCRAIRLSADADAVDAAVRAARAWAIV